MPIAQDVKRIAKDIEMLHDTRVAFLSDLFRETDETLKRFNREHYDMAANLRNLLRSNRESREEAVNNLRSQNVKDLTAMAEKLDRFLTENRSTLAENTATLMTQIKDSLNEIEKEIAGLLSTFNSDRKAMAKEMREELTSATKNRIEEVKRTLTDFASEHEERSNLLREELSSFQKKLAKSVKEMRAPVIRDLKAAKDNWQELAKTMAGKRAGKPAPKKQETAKKTAEPGGAAATDLKEEALRLISENPTGITMQEMGKALKTMYIRLAKPVSKLVKEGKVTKKNSNYFLG